MGRAVVAEESSFVPYAEYLSTLPNIKLEVGLLVGVVCTRLYNRRLCFVDNT
jgi:hypothetical protein